MLSTRLKQKELSAGNALVFSLIILVFGVVLVTTTESTPFIIVAWAAIVVGAVMTFKDGYRLLRRAR